MARDHRRQLVTINFDGLTDVVTNLAGTLILLVVLVMGMTTEARPPLPGGPSSGDRTDRSTGPLSRQIQWLRLEIETVDRQIRRIEQGVGERERRIEQLRQQAAAIQAPENGPSRDLEPKTPRQIRYRPPLEQRTYRQTLVFCCWQGEIRPVDVGAIDEPFIRRRLAEIAAREPRGAGRQAFDFPLPGTVLRCQGSVEGRPGTPGFRGQWAAVLDPAALDPGETAEAAGNPGSRFQRVLATHQPGRCCLNFAVWPDSYPAYRAARSIAWRAGYDVGWQPIASGEPLRLQPGPGLID